ncbi:rod shape-determining protein MreD [Hyphomicrobium methylovorum]|uniref:rod shape-determining protein MreD n=1 Tax=Hyphomicrobium methylovorum TaxID=84 RepID=UPI0015E73B6A|nr:rod shape-determining protein MreD [Hyphomicrobium methylovorum]MBA2127367.1 rod shape-determining protein MreD [Hyphomicrobium methylovorum]
MTWRRLVAPIGSVAVLTLIAALPLGIPAGDRFFLPLLPAVAIHYWTLRHDAWLPEWVVFLAGLTLDVLTNGPLGYWALIYLLVHLAATVSTRYALGGTFSRLILLGLAILSVTVVAWAVASLYFFEFLDWRPYATGALLASIASLFVLLPILRFLDNAAARDRNVRLERGS